MDPSCPASSSSSHPAGRHSEGRSLPLKARYGINAWKRWASSPPDQSDDTKVTESSKTGQCNWPNVLPSVLAEWLSCLLTVICLFPAPAARSRSNVLLLSSEELSVALSQFVREVCRPSGERYSPDSILYLCLGIQQVGTRHTGTSPVELLHRTH